MNGTAKTVEGHLLARIGHRASASANHWGHTSSHMMPNHRTGKTASSSTNANVHSSAGSDISISSTPVAAPAPDSKKRQYQCQPPQPYCQSPCQPQLHQSLKHPFQHQRVKMGMEGKTRVNLTRGNAPLGPAPTSTSTAAHGTWPIMLAVRVLESHAGRLLHELRHEDWLDTMGGGAPAPVRPPAWSQDGTGMGPG